MTDERLIDSFDFFCWILPDATNAGIGGPWCAMEVATERAASLLDRLRQAIDAKDTERTARLLEGLTDGTSQAWHFWSDRAECRSKLTPVK